MPGFDDGYYDDNPWGDSISDLRTACRRIAQLPSVPPTVVRIAPVTSFAAQTVTSSSLALGEPSSRYVNYYLVRREAASAADRVRQVTAFDGSTGTFTHAGTAYSDTTATDEYIEVWLFDPLQMDFYAQEVLRSCRRMDRDLLPANGGAEYPLDSYPWVSHRGHVQRLLYSGTPIVGRNVYFDNWNTVSNAGALEPDEWTKTNGTWSRLHTNPWRGQFEVTVVRSGSTVTVEQYIGGGPPRRSILGDGVDSLRSQPFGVMLMGRTAVASQGRIFIDDGSTVYSSYHTGGGTHEELSKEITVSATAPYIRYGFVVEADGAFNVSACVPFVGSLSDAIRKDIYYGRDVEFGWRDRPQAIVPNHRINRGSSYILETWRPYPMLDPTRLLAGSADTDESDIPTDLWAYGIASHLFGAQGEEWATLASQMRGEYERLRGAYQWDVRPSRLKTKPLGPRLMRV